MQNKCSDTNRNGCPASFYLRCKGYKEGLNCWEISEKPCCSCTDLSTCRQC